MAQDYLKALGLAASKPKEEVQPKQERQQAGVAVQLQMTGIPPLDEIIQALNVMAQTIDSLPPALDAFGPSLEKAFMPVVEAMKAQDAKIEAQGSVIASLAGKVEALSALQERANAIALAPVMPEFDAAGKIKSARKVM